MIGVGTYVRYNNNEYFDSTIGIVEEIDTSNGTVKVRWFDGAVRWYTPFGLIKL